MSLPPRLTATALAIGGLLTLGGTAHALQSASVADLSLSPAPYSHQPQVSAGTMVLSVSNDEANGFEVSVQSSALVYSGLHGGTNIPASAFAIVAAAAPTVISGQAIDPTGGPAVPAGNSTGSLDQARTVLRAEASFGNGTYEQGLDVELTLPAMARAGTYTATLTVTITAAP